MRNMRSTRIAYSDRQPAMGTTVQLVIFMLVFVVATTAAHSQTYTVLYNFGKNSSDPIYPEGANVAQGRDGNLYSVTPGGGVNDYGAIFMITRAGALNLVHSFAGSDGRQPWGGLTLGTNGNFYGTTAYGGDLSCYAPYGCGVAFRLDASGQERVLHDFVGGGDSSVPFAPPIQATNGNFYGTTGCVLDWGSVFKMTPSGALTTLYRFQTGALSCPGVLLQGTDGDFYGLASGGSYDLGLVFKITAAGQLTVLYNFDGTHGSYPVDPLVRGSDGNFYGTTQSGGGFGCNGNGCGVIFKMTPAGELTVLHNMTASTDGAGPLGLVQATDGNFYGLANQGGHSSNCSGGCGTIFRISQSGSYSVLHNFDLTTGGSPVGTLLQHTDGLFYSDTYIGGAYLKGTFFSLNVGLGPFVAFVSPLSSGKVGTKVQILGQGFKGTTAVSFNGTAASFKVASDTYLTATVPSGATTGFVTVTTPHRTLTSNKKFRVTQ
jgi:uncharacterized repeat protein (TIGR03803 family)